MVVLAEMCSGFDDKTHVLYNGLFHLVYPINGFI